MEVNRSFVIDTNAYSAFKRGDEEAVEVIIKAESIIFSSIVLGELLAGFSLGSRYKKNLEELREFLDESKVLFLSVNAQTSEAYANIYKMLRENGTPIPTNDMWIAAMAMQLDLPVFTYDAHFENVNGLEIVRSVQDF
ncbi:MAG: type II toxin-antitoxin system VapC family toxin [Bacteroidota bacterium]